MAGKAIPTTSWTTRQPGLGLLALVISLVIVFGITVGFSMEQYMGLFTVWAISMIPVLAMMFGGWGGKYPPCVSLEQPWRGMAYLAFLFGLGTLACFWVIRFVGGGTVHPATAVYTIIVVNLSFFAFIAFGMWPFHKMSSPANGILTLICVYLIGYAGYEFLFNFDMLSYPTGVNPSPIGAVPFYASQGPLAALSAPSGVFAWESALAFWMWMLIFLFAFAALGMWPFSKFPKLMRTQPLFGFVLSLSTFALAFIAYAVGLNVMKMEPIRFLLDGICFLFGILMMMNLFEMWPAQKVKPPANGFIILAVSIAVGIAAFYGLRAFNTLHFGQEAMAYPNNWMSMANVMLALAFPIWILHSAFFGFWPLRAAPPSIQEGI